MSSPQHRTASGEPAPVPRQGDPAQVRNRERARDRRAFAAAAVALFVLFLGNNMPSALYGLFRAAFGFSALTQTLLYSVAVAVILVGLLIFGPLADVTGRRVLVAAGLVVFGVGDALFAVAHGTGWLYGARVAQGLGMGLAVTAGGLTVMIGMSAAAQLAARRVPVVTAQVTGLVMLAIGLIVLVGATLDGSAVLAALAMVGCGVGHGFVFGGEMVEVLLSTPPAERAGVLGLVYFVNYSGLGGPVIAVGAAALSVGLVTATRVAAVVIAAACVALVPFMVRPLRART